MRKFTAPIPVLLLLVILALAGCGGETGSSILDKSMQTMEQVKSLKMNVDVISEESGQKQEDSYEAVMVRSDENPDAYNMMLVTDATETEDNIYFVDGYQYIVIAGDWYKSPVDQEAAMGLGQFEQLKEVSDEMKVTSESGDGWTLSFDLSDEFLKDAMTKGTEGLDTMGPEFDEMVKSFVENTKIGGELQIAKSTYYLEVMKTLMDADIEGLGSFSIDATVKFSDFDKEFKVKLPADAKNAQDLPDDMEMPELPFSDPLSF
ncbi:MAG: hypothetical protein KKB90_09935 [Actinobacteria bacterium]|nr:hypothetical protein [Actinomycetota bacterium]MCG2819760.1 hypothetical protein [Actinomycetes bacterium]MBU4178672.1 hypothetical protein [Actinomycetota bacterium]MBU4219264.1 hypothetical protein [Actinomycetota bacterium]MBU4359548.1 hypothetical protein [Actinomycetota bacterium]